MIPLAINTDVIYHGSLTDYRDVPMIVTYVTDEDPANLSADNHRYTLKYGSGKWDYLYNVRRQSFTVVNHTTEENGHA